MRAWPAKVFRSGKKPFVVEKVAKSRGSFGLDNSFPVDEETIQVSIVEWLRLVLPGALIWHTPNGGWRDPREAAKLKRMGVLPGIPDIIVFMEGAFAFSLECKTQRGTLSDDQKNVHSIMRLLGFKVATVRGIDESRQALASWGVKTREAA